MRQEFQFEFTVGDEPKNWDFEQIPVDPRFTYFPNPEPGSWLSYARLGKPAGIRITLDTNCFMNEVIDNWLAASDNTWGLVGGAVKVFSPDVSAGEAATHVGVNTAVNLTFSPGVDRVLGTKGIVTTGLRVGRTSFRTGSISMGARVGLRSLGFRTAGQVAANFAIRGGALALVQETAMFYLGLGYTIFHHDRCKVDLGI